MKKICLVASGLQPHTLRLQPWRYLHQVAFELAQRGHTVTLISDGPASGPDEELAGVPIQRIATVTNPRWGHNTQLEAALRTNTPDTVIWHLGKTSFLHQRFRLPDVTNLGIFTSPLYHMSELAALGLVRLIKGYELSAVHVLGTLIPRQVLRHSLSRNLLDGLVVQTATTRTRLIELGLEPHEVTVISPGIDDGWYQQQADESLRANLGFTSQDKVIVYFGAPSSLRGLHTLLRAFAIARQQDAQLKLLILSRRHADELIKEDAQLGRLLNDPAIAAHVHLRSGYLSATALIHHVAAADVVALPFELVPSDAPLSLLEAQALAKPIITTDTACLSELTSVGCRYLAQPADVPSLARAIQRATQGARSTLSGHHITAPPIRRWRQVGTEWSHFIQSR